MSEEIFHTPRELGSEERERSSESHEVSSPPTEASQESERRWPVRRIAVTVGIVVLAVLAGLVVWQVYFPSPSKRLQAGEAYWRAGQLARQQRDWNQAIQRFARAVAVAEEVIQRLERRAPQPGETAPSQEDEWLGQAYWLRARALFGLGAAQMEQEAAEKGTSPPAALPSPDDDALELFLLRDEVRAEAVVSLYRASSLLPRQSWVLREALKHRMNEPMDHWHWPHMHYLAQAIEQISPPEPSTLARAYYVLALYHFHQPESAGPQDPGQPRPPEKRDPERLLQAEQYLTKLEGVEKPLRFRAVYLRAQIWHQLANPRLRKLSAQIEDAKVYRQRLEQLLFDAQHGLPGALGEQAEAQWNTLSPLDVEGVFGLYRLALSYLGKTENLSADALTERKQRLLASALRLTKQAQTLAQSKPATAWRAVSETLRLLQELREDRSAKWWSQAVTQVDAVAEAIAGQASQVLTPNSCADLAEILTIQARSLDKSQLPDCKQRIKVWLSRARSLVEKLGGDDRLKTRLDRIHRNLNDLP